MIFAALALLVGLIHPAYPGPPTQIAPSSAIQPVIPDIQPATVICGHLVAHHALGPPSEVFIVVVLRGHPHSAAVTLYAYCDGEPVNRADPTGLDWISMKGNVVMWHRDSVPNDPGIMVGSTNRYSRGDGQEMVTFFKSGTIIDLPGYDMSLQELAAAAKDVHLPASGVGDFNKVAAENAWIARSMKFRQQHIAERWAPAQAGEDLNFTFNHLRKSRDILAQAGISPEQLYPATESAKELTAILKAGGDIAEFGYELIPFVGTASVLASEGIGTGAVVSLGGDLFGFVKLGKVVAKFRKIRVVGAAQKPIREFIANAGGLIRRGEDAVELAKARLKHTGLSFDDVDIYFLGPEDADLLIKEGARAQYYGADLPGGTIIRWKDLLVNGKVPVRIRDSVLGSDEEIAGVIAHELYEINELKRIFAESGGSMTAERLHALTRDGIEGNLHARAWDLVNDLLEGRK